MIVIVCVMNHFCLCRFISLARGILLVTNVSILLLAKTCGFWQELNDPEIDGFTNEDTENI